MNDPENPLREKPPENFEPPPCARVWIGTDFDGNDASVIKAPGPKPGTTVGFARDGSSPRRSAATGAKEVSRAEFEAFADQFDESGAEKPES